jgi:glycosyltransferase involved in cell wall biosynthesis
MRYAILPLIPTSRYVKSESDYLVYSHLIEQADIERRGYFYFCLTEKQRPFVQMWNRNNVMFIFNKEHDEFYYMQSNVPPNFIELFNPLLGKHYVDCILTSRSGAAALMSKLLWDKRVKLPEIAIINIEPKVIEWESTHNAICPQDLLLRAAGYAVSCNLFATERERRLAEKLCKEYLSPAMALNAMKNSHVIPLGIRCDEIDSFVQSVPKADKFTLFFGGRLTANKQWQKVLADYEKFFSFGRDLDLVVCAPLGSTSLFKAERWGTWGEINLGLPRKEYLSRLTSCHVSMSNSLEEGFTVGIVEQIYAGLVVLLPRREWATSLLGDAAKHYPFFYSGGHEEAYTVLKYVYENYEEARAQMEPVREYIRKNYDFSIVSQKTFDVMESFVLNLRRRVRRTESKEFRRLVDRVLDLNVDQVSFSQFMEKIKEYTTGDVSGAERNYRSGFPSKWQVYQFLVQRGYSDTYQFANPILVGERDGKGCNSQDS